MLIYFRVHVGIYLRVLVYFECMLVYLRVLVYLRCTLVYLKCYILRVHVGILKRAGILRVHVGMLLHCKSQTIVLNCDRYCIVLDHQV